MVKTTSSTCQTVLNWLCSSFDKVYGSCSVHCHMGNYDQMQNKDKNALGWNLMGHICTLAFFKLYFSFSNITDTLRCKYTFTVLKSAWTQRGLNANDTPWWVKICVCVSNFFKAVRIVQAIREVNMCVVILCHPFPQANCSPWLNLNSEPVVSLLLNKTSKRNRTDMNKKSIAQ